MDLSEIPVAQELYDLQAGLEMVAGEAFITPPWTAYDGPIFLRDADDAYHAVLEGRAYRAQTGAHHPDANRHREYLAGRIGALRDLLGD